MDIIFDVDGTLLNIEHRVPLIRPTNGGHKDWKAFREAAKDDQPNHEIIEIAGALLNVDHRLVICTGRMEKEREVTTNTLRACGLPVWGTDKLSLDCFDIRMYMRRDGDVRPDHVVKLEMLLQMREDGYKPMLAFDDRQQVVDMWRAAGIRCCQVAKGDF